MTQLRETASSKALLDTGHDNPSSDARLRRAEEALRRSEEKLRVALDAARLGTWERDLRTGEFTASSTCKANLGLPPDAALTFEQLQGMRHPDDLARVSEAIQGAIANRTDYDVEYRVLRPDGSVGHIIARGHAVYDNGQPIRMIGVTLDVTERERDRRAFQDLERRQRFLLDLNDRLQDVEDPLAIIEAVSAMLGSHFDGCRAGYGEIDPEGTLVVEREWTDGTVKDGPGHRHVEEFGPAAMADLVSGKTLRIEDVSTDPRMTAMVDDYAVLGTRSMLIVPVVKGRHLTAILFLHRSQPQAWCDEDVSLVKDVSERVWAAIERARTEANLRMSESRFRTIAEALPALVWILGTDLKLTYANERWIRYAGLTAETSLGYSWMEAFHPDDLKRVIADSEHLIQNESDYTAEARYRALDGEYRWHMIQAEPLRNARGEFVGWCGASVDIHDRKLAEERQQLLIRELHHRVKNTLATVQAIVSSTARTASSIDEFYQGFVGRIVSLAHTHDLLTNDLWQKASIDELLKAELGPYEDRDRARITLEGPVVELPSEAAVPIGMAIHELTTNAAKHGALSRSGGRIDVRWSVEPGEDERSTLHFAWIESGGPPVQAPTSQGFGSRLLKRVLTSQLEARVEMDFPTDGLRFTMVMPMPREAALLDPLQ